MPLRDPYLPTPASTSLLRPVWIRPFCYSSAFEGHHVKRSRRASPPNHHPTRWRYAWGAVAASTWLAPSSTPVTQSAPPLLHDVAALVCLVDSQPPPKSPNHHLRLPSITAQPLFESRWARGCDECFGPLWAWLARSDGTCILPRHLSFLLLCGGVSP